MPAPWISAIFARHRCRRPVTRQTGRVRLNLTWLEDRTVPTTVASVQVNDGSVQRSEVRSITVTFSDPVTFPGSNSFAGQAFRLQRVMDGTSVDLMTNIATDSQGRTQAILTFVGPDTDPESGANGGLPSLEDGKYRLTIFASHAFGPGSVELDGAGTGTPGSNYYSPNDTLGGGAGQLHLCRLFGDMDGNGVVDQIDLGRFRSTFNFGAATPGFLPEPGF